MRTAADSGCKAPTAPLHLVSTLRPLMPHPALRLRPPAALAARGFLLPRPRAEGWRAGVSVGDESEER